MATRNKGKVGIIGSGLVGKSWAMIFASVGFKVEMYDVEAKQVEKALGEIFLEIDKFEAGGVLRGDVKGSEQKKLITSAISLADCVKDAVYVQECVPEILELKRSVWKQIDSAVTNPQSIILASSTSCIVPSKISDDLSHRDRFIVAHPVNPPYHAPMVELVPAPWTAESVRADTRAMMQRVGQVPVSLTKEVPGFVLNRIQYAILNECWRLVAGDIVSAEDLDVVMKDGLGLRYAFMGPMETIHLNADGTKNYCDRYGETIYDVSNTMGEVPTAWTQKSDGDKAEVEKVRQQLEALYPLDKLYERRVRRDTCLAALAKLKKDLPK